METPTPSRCTECAKFYRQRLHAACRVCRDFGLDEALLCDLNGMIQKPEAFQCRAFQPQLTPVGKAADEGPVSFRTTPPASQLKFLRDFLKSDKIKYRRALALQKLEQDPDEVIISLKYHLLWNTAQRRSVFNPPKVYFEDLSDLFEGYGELAGGVSALMWLAKDHVHVYLESDGRYSIEVVVKEFKAASARDIHKRLPELTEKLAKGRRLWDKAYFVETIG